MHAAVVTLLASLATVAVAAQQSAYAIFPSSFPFAVDFEESAQGTGVTIMAGELPVPGPFEYHIHVNPVSGADCASTGGHFDPLSVTARGVQPVKGNVDTYEVGDLSGKYGAVHFRQTIRAQDSTIKMSGDPGMSILGRSVVVHYQGARVACANILVDTGVAVDLSNTTQTLATNSVGDQTGRRTMEMQRHCCEGFDWNMDKDMCLPKAGTNATECKCPQGTAGDRQTNLCLPTTIPPPEPAPAPRSVTPGTTNPTTTTTTSMTAASVVCYEQYYWDAQLQRCVPGSPSATTACICGPGFTCDYNTYQCKSNTPAPPTQPIVPAPTQPPSTLTPGPLNFLCCKDHQWDQTKQQCVPKTPGAATCVCPEGWRCDDVTKLCVLYTPSAPTPAPSTQNYTTPAPSTITPAPGTYVPTPGPSTITPGTNSTSATPAPSTITPGTNSTTVMCCVDHQWDATQQRCVPNSPSAANVCTCQQGYACDVKTFQCHPIQSPSGTPPSGSPSGSPSGTPSGTPTGPPSATTTPCTSATTPSATPGSGPSSPSTAGPISGSTTPGSSLYANTVTPPSGAPQTGGTTLTPAGVPASQNQSKVLGATSEQSFAAFSVIQSAVTLSSAIFAVLIMV